MQTSLMQKIEQIKQGESEFILKYPFNMFMRFCGFIQ